jgi:hypothetical protein
MGDEQLDAIIAELEEIVRIAPDEPHAILPELQQFMAEMDAYNRRKL